MDVIELLFIILPFLCTIKSEINTTQQYKNMIELGETDDPSMTVYWKIAGENITFEIHTKTTGWVGIGFSKNGGMLDADMVVGWVKNGDVTITDRYGIANAYPSLDARQDVHAITGTECNGWTMIKFSRQLAACDETYDRSITDDSTKLIWAYGKTDPSGNDLSQGDYHNGFRGSTSAFLLDSADMRIRKLSTGPEYKTLDILANDFVIPAEQTFYNCRLFKIPELRKKHHIIKVEPIIQDSNRKKLHHIVVYQCGDIRMAYFYPDEVGLSIGGDNDPVYLLMETHYDNPLQESGINDNSGMRFTFTDSLRKYDAGVMYVGNAVINTQHFVPPGAESFQNSGFCFPECLGKGMKASGLKNITVFGTLLHSHLAARAVRLRHVRNGRELPCIAKDDSYDSNYQETMHVKPPVTILPTDSLIIDCYYNTTDRRNMTMGGLGTKDEMCIAFVMYYPKMNTAICSSSVSAYRSWPYLGIDLTQIRYDPVAPPGLQSLYLAGPAEMEGKTLWEVMNEYDWTTENIDKFSTFMRTTIQQSICTPMNNKSATTTLEYPPPYIVSKYIPTIANCSGSSDVLRQKTEAMSCPSVTPSIKSASTHMVTNPAFVTPDGTTMGAAITLAQRHGENTTNGCRLTRISVAMLFILMGTMISNCLV